ncbi:MAG: PQQ-binding-like beta-propeller repeat protein [Bacteroidetes bacterium]|nr:PQQ-binding-like beta-propeller repeat protein [Bacteroidota bacterium]
MISRARALLLLGSLMWLSCGTSGSLRIGTFFEKSNLPAWSVIGGNERRDHYFDGGLTPPMELVWVKKISSAPSAHVLVSDNVVYVSTLDSRVYAFILSDGRQVGSLKFKFASQNGISLDHQTAYIALAWGEKPLYAYNLFDADFKYSVRMPPVETNPIVHEEYLYLGGLDGKFYALNPEDGKTLWTFEASKPIRSSPALSSTAVYFGCDDGFVYSLNRFSGSLIWKFRTGGTVYATPALDDQFVYIGSTDGKFYVLGKADGKLHWTFSVGDTVPGRFYASAGLSSDCVFLGATDGNVYALSKKDGRLFWTFKTGGAVSVAPLVTPDAVFVGSQNGMLYALEPSGGKCVWTFETNSRIKSEMAAYGKYLIVASERKHVYVFRSAMP